MKTIYAFTISAVFFTLSLPAQNRYFVKANGAANGAATSWSTASNNLQATVNKAVAGDTVYVAIGTYKGGFFMKEGVTVLGGYTMNVADPFRRIYPGDLTAAAANRTILDGEGKQRVLTQTGNFSLPTYWEGFVIQNGKPAPEITAGTLIFPKNGSKDITGVIYKYDAASRKGMILSINTIKTQWGGYQEELPALPYKTEADITNGSSGVDNTAAIVSAFGENNMDFGTESYEKNGNYAAKWCDDLNVGGYSDWYLPTANDLNEISAVKESLANLVSLQNGYWTSDHLGDYLAWAYYFEAGKTHPLLKFHPKTVRAVHEVQFGETLDDMYNAGGGVFLGKNGVLRNCVVKNNESPSIGGGVFAGKGSVVSNCLMYGNLSQKEGSGIYASADITEGTIVINTTISGNNGDNGFVTDNASVELLNSIVWGNTDTNGNPANISGSGHISFSCIEGGTAGNDNINGNPLFLDTGAGNYQSPDESPAVNAGNTVLFDLTKWGNKDVAGKNRIAGRIDMGAYENQVNTAIDKVSTDDPIISVQYYNLIGTRLTAPAQSGVYIIKELCQSGKVNVRKGH
jgi:hypothetical protein